MWRDILPGGRVSASDINNLADWGEQTVTGNVGVTRSAAGLHIAAPDDARILIRITGEADAGAYPWEEVYRDAVLGSIEVVGDGREGTTDDVPAYELNDTEDVPEGTVVEATLDESGEFLVFEVPGSALPGATVTTVDGTPSYTDIETWKFDEADGFVLTNPDTGVVRIDIAAAYVTRTGSPSGPLAYSIQDGIVTDDAQHWKGGKTFFDGISIGNPHWAAASDGGDSNSPNCIIGFDNGLNLGFGGWLEFYGASGQGSMRLVTFGDDTVSYFDLFDEPYVCAGNGAAANFFLACDLSIGGVRAAASAYGVLDEFDVSWGGVYDTQGGLIFKGGLFCGGTLAVPGSAITGTIDGGTW